MNGRKMNTDTRGKTQKARHKALVFSLWSLVFSLLLSGCAGQQQFETVEQICIEEKRLAAEDTEKPINAIMQAAEEVLGRMHFTVEKADAEFGYIRTRPLTGAQFFEFWRKDNVGAFNSLQANLHTIRRIVELNISRQDGQLCLGCDVNVQRLNMPEYKNRKSSQTYDMFSESDSSIQRLKLHPEQKEAMVWVDLGRDTRLSTVILKRLEEKLAAKTVGPRTPKHEE